MAHILKAFISYRRHDAYIPLKDSGEPDFTFIYEIKAALGRVGFTEVFVDTDAIKSGENYESKIHKEISDSDLIVAVVGKRWLDILQDRIVRKERDTLVREIRAGLRQEKEIVPLLVDGATMPPEDELPEQIHRG